MEAESQRSTLSNMVVAPGSMIYSTWNGANGLMYNTLMGTSQASPLVAGMVALMQDAAYTFGGRYLTPTEVQTIVRDTADHLVDAQNPDTERFPVATNSSGNLVQTGPLQDLTESGLTYDRVNIYRAVQAVRALVTQSSISGGSSNDTNDTMASATTLQDLNATTSDYLQGNIGADGQVPVDANDVDVYRVTLDSPGQITIALAAVSGGQTFSPVIRLFDSGGNELASTSGSPGSYPTLTSSSSLVPGTYYIGVSSQANSLYSIVDGSDIASGGSTGDYQATVSLSNPDPNGVVQGAVQEDLTQPDEFDPLLNVPANYETGLIGSDPNPADSSLPRIQIGATDVDMFKVVAPDTGILTVDVQSQSVYGSSGINPFLLLYDSNLNRIDAGYGEGCLQDNVTIGQTYYVAVTTFGTAVNSQGQIAIDPSTPYNRHSTTGQTGNYDVYLSFDNGDQNGTVFSAVSFASSNTNNVVSGNIGKDYGQQLLGANGGSKDVDFISYVPASSGLLELSAISPDSTMAPSITLWQYDATANAINKIADATGAAAAIDYPVTQGQTYYFSITGQGNEGFNWYAVASGSGGDTGNYQLRAVGGPMSDATALNNGSVNSGTPTSIALDDPILGDIGMDGPLVIGAADVDLYSFTAQHDESVTIVADASRAGSADTFLRLFDSSGNELAYNDNMSDSSSSSLLTVRLTGGQTYYIGVDGAGPQARNYNPLTGVGAAAGSTGAYTLVITQVSTANDATPPTSQVDALPAWSTANISVHWTGKDNAGGSGIVNYDVYVSDNGGDYTLWQDHAAATSAVYTGVESHTYSFYSVARDFAGNLESAPASAQATTMVDAIAPTSQMLPITASPTAAIFRLDWSGSDDADGSGIAGYDIYYSVDGGPYTIWRSMTTDTSGTFHAPVAPATYSFYSLAHDVAGNIEAAPDTPDATITLTRNVQTLTPTARSWSFHDANNALVTIKLSGPGNVDLVRGVAATAQGNLVEMDVTNTTTSSSISITVTPAPGAVIRHTTIGDINISGSLGSFSAATSDFSGDFALDGVISRVTLGDVSNGQISIGSLSGSTIWPTITLGSVSDLSMTSETPIKSIACIDWLDPSGAGADITAPLLGKLTVTGRRATTTLAAIGGDFQADLAISDAVASTAAALGSASIAGELSGSDWNINGKLGSVMVKGAVDSWTLHSEIDQLVSLSSLSVGNVSSTTLDFSGAIGRITDQSWASGAITAGTLGSLNSRAGFAADLTLAGPALPRQNVLGGASMGMISGGTWTIAGPVGNLTAPSASAWTLDITGAAGTLHSLALKDRNAVSSPTISAVSIGSVNVAGGLSNASFNLMQAVDPLHAALGTFYIGGAMNNSEVLTRGNINSVTVRTMNDSLIFASVNADAVPAGLPTSADQFDNADPTLLATIKSVKILGPITPTGQTPAPSYINSSIAAGKINYITVVGTVADQDDSGGDDPTPFGFAARQPVISYHGPAANGDFEILVV